MSSSSSSEPTQSTATISVNPINIGGWWSPGSQEVEVGDSATIYIDPFYGAYLNQVYGCDGDLVGDLSDYEYTISNVTEDCEVTILYGNQILIEGAWTNSNGYTNTGNPTYWFELPHQTRVYALANSLVDNVLILVDENGTPLYEVDDTQGYGTNAVLDQTLEAGTYGLAMATFDNNQSGIYEIIIQSSFSYFNQASPDERLSNWPITTYYEEIADTNSCRQVTIPERTRIHSGVTNSMTLGRCPIKEYRWQCDYTEGENIYTDYYEYTDVHFTVTAANLCDQRASGILSRPRGYSLDDTHSRRLQGRWDLSNGQSAYGLGNPEFEFEVLSSGEITATIYSSLDSFLYILDENGNVVASADDSTNHSDNNLDASLNIVLPKGTYTAVAATFNENQTGTFELYLGGPIDYNGQAVFGTWDATGALSGTNIQTGFMIEEAGLVKFNVTGTHDNVLWVENMEGEIVAYNDDYGSWLNASASAYLEEGVYILTVDSFDPNVNGSFSATINTGERAMMILQNY
ncbi:hypothetical protein SCD92_05035 [Gilvimarinus sp. SDUM040013]|uniref:Peptidase C-terminal archaeal/bacterial domain-containing protein n=1 Tax=Gilvimarinus gilvus TaxID=3058038 RepID=A0ABU4RV09_9GAMM|nr:hypothetical protein [Gilvimarinus sp. SDUM040013]MDX6848713.1 hypothetical protein [Gilvimarinus sp. SDUM040013]